MMLIMVLTFVIVSTGCFPPRQIDEDKQHAKRIGGGFEGALKWTLRQETHLEFSDGMGALIYNAFEDRVSEEKAYRAFVQIYDKRKSGWRIEISLVTDRPQSLFDHQNVDHFFWSRFYDAWARICMRFDRPLDVYKRLKPQPPFQDYEEDAYSFVRRMSFE